MADQAASEWTEGSTLWQSTFYQWGQQPAKLSKHKNNAFGKPQNTTINSRIALDVCARTAYGYMMSAHVHTHICKYICLHVDAYYVSVYVYSYVLSSYREQPREPQTQKLLNSPQQLPTARATATPLKSREDYNARRVRGGGGRSATESSILG